MSELAPWDDPMRYLSARREEAGYSIAELADRSGISGISLSHFESNHSLPTFQQILRLSEVLDCSLADLFRSEAA